MPCIVGSRILTVRHERWNQRLIRFYVLRSAHAPRSHVRSRLVDQHFVVLDAMFDPVVGDVQAPMRRLDSADSQRTREGRPPYVNFLVSHPISGNGVGNRNSLTRWLPRDTRWIACEDLQRSNSFSNFAKFSFPRLVPLKETNTFSVNYLKPLDQNLQSIKGNVTSSFARDRFRRQFWKSEACCFGVEPSGKWIFAYLSRSKQLGRHK